jgi:SAM-dependent methyltransferase
MTKYPRYQDYVIRDGHLIGEFEQMYRDFSDPWHESTLEQFASDKAAGINLLVRLKAQHQAKRVMEVGCGLGHYAERIAELGLETVGIDISPTAVANARSRHNRAKFIVGTIDQHDIFRRYRPDVVVLAEVTWYVLEQLRGFLDFMRAELPNSYLLHLLNTYPPGVQKYGTEYFTDLAGIKRYIGMLCLECGEVHADGGGARTWFLGTWDPQAQQTWNSLQVSPTP